MDMRDCAPIVLFVYNRLSHTQKTLDALRANYLAAYSDLIIFSDAAKLPADADSVSQVRAYSREVTGFKSIRIVERSHNLGLAKSIISGVSDVIDTHGRVIVVEDDIETTPNFLTFMNAALAFYQDSPQVFSISGYHYPFSIPGDYPFDSYFSYRCCSWGWGTWADRWKKVNWDVPDIKSLFKDTQAFLDFSRGGPDLPWMYKAQYDGKINTWDIAWCYAHHEFNSFGVNPTISKVKNTGNDGSGVHCGVTDMFTGVIDSAGSTVFNFPKQPFINADIQRSHYLFFQYPLKSRLKLWVKRKLFNFMSNFVSK